MAPIRLRLCVFGIGVGQLYPLRSSGLRRWWREASRTGALNIRQWGLEMKYILFDSEGNLITRYDSDINQYIDPSAVQVADENLFFRTIEENDGIWKLVNGEITKLPLPVFVESFESKVARYERAVEAHLNAGAKAAGFDNIDRARIPAGYPNPKQALAITFGTWHTD